MNDNMNNNMNNVNNVNNPNVIQNGFNNQQVPVQPMPQQPNVVPNAPTINNQMPVQQSFAQPMGAVPQQNPMYNQPVQPSKKNDSLIVIIIGVVIVGLIVAILVLFINDNKKDSDKGKDNKDNNVIVENDDEENDIDDDNNNGITNENDNSNNNTSDSLPNDWKSMQFIFDGNKYSLKTPYSLIKNSGWEMDLNKMGYPNGYIVKPNTKVLSTVNLYNSNYSKASVKIGLINEGTVEKDITECDVWSFVVDSSSYYDNINFQLPGGIKNGSTYAEVEAMYGKENDTYRSDTLKYTVYTYTYDYNKTLKLTIYDDGGLKGFSYQLYE